ncbi:hypothetical protein P12x_003198 [Tundrisphaera lichenicola]|uniref:hypothetical protein n=1 Tax=Tundrisphaera lichenicola TaxID=2029860 RepID=UPI003EB843F5
MPPSTKPTGWLDLLRGWLYLPSGELATIRRVSGGLLLCILPEVWFWSRGGPGPYHVPAFWVGGHPIDLPLPLPWVDAWICAAYVLAALAMIFDRAPQWAPALAASILAYHAWRDVRACNSSYVQLLFFDLIALLFANGPINPARRLIQFGLTCCYGFAVIQKLAMPEWRGGETLLAILAHADGVRPIWVPLLRAMAPGPDLAGFLALVVIGVEAFIGVGLWWARTRKLAMIVGAGLHLGFAAIFPGTEIFAPVMFTGYLAFLGPGSSDLSAIPRRRFEMTLALAFLVAMVAIPARIYVPPMRPWHLLTHMDHLPWTYSMFSQIDRIDSVEVTITDHPGMTRRVEPVGRMLQASSDAEMIALARHVLRSHPGADRAEVVVRLTVNHRRELVKSLRWVRGEVPSIEVREVAKLPEPSSLSGSIHGLPGR